MIGYIEGRAPTAVSKDDIKHLIECAKALRFGCVEQREEEQWDDWLEHCEKVLGEETFRRLVAEGLGYLKRSNEAIYKTDELHPMEQDEFDDLD